MDVMTMARSIGLVAADRREVSGTIEEAAVLDAIAELAEATPADDDLYADAAMRVQLARSAGTVHADEQRQRNACRHHRERGERVAHHHRESRHAERVGEHAGEAALGRDPLRDVMRDDVADPGLREHAAEHREREW